MENPDESTSSPPQQVLQNSGEGIKTILIAADTSAGASRVIAMGARLSRPFPAAAVHIVHVFRTHRFDRARAGAPATSGEAVEDAKDHLASHVRDARRQCRNEVNGHFVVGDPTSEVVRLSEQLRADLLIVGTHDYSGFERFLLGSVAETLVRKASCTVVVVRPGRPATE